MTTKLIALIVSTSILSACAVTQESKPVEVQLDAAVAKSQASALSTAVASANADDGLSIAEAVASVGDVAAALLPPTKSGGQRRVKQSATTCTCDAATKSCVFAACTLGSATVSGALSWADGQIRCTGLTLEVAATSSAIGAASVNVDCAITYGTAQLAGNLKTTGSAVVEGITYSWDATLTASDVTFTTSAFTGGSLSANATVTSSSSSAADKSYTASATIALP
jgi:hypothetical protein